MVGRGLFPCHAARWVPQRAAGRDLIGACSSFSSEACPPNRGCGVRCYCEREEAMEEGLVVIGVDAHKRTHTLVASDAVGRRLAETMVEATSDGHLVGLESASRWPRRKWAVEDCRHLTRRLESDLLRAGEQLVRVPTKMMSGARRAAREAGKSDPIDALAVARAAWREPDLPIARLDGPERKLRLLVDHRDDLVRERTRIQSRIRWYLHQ